jgi:hypothetical protein
MNCCCICRIIDHRGRWCQCSLADWEKAGALLGHLSQGAPVPSAFRLPAGVAPARVAAALREALTEQPPAESDWTPPADLCAHLLDRLRALEPADIRFLHELGAGAAALPHPLSEVTPVLRRRAWHHPAEAGGCSAQPTCSQTPLNTHLTYRLYTII